MTILAIILTLALLALFISRVHFHFHFTLEITRERKFRPVRVVGRESKSRPGISGEGPAGPRIAHQADVAQAIDTARLKAQHDLESALVNQGVKGKRAQQVAAAAMVQGGNDFDSRLRWALRNAA